ncbi:unnamed protein product [Cylindrotheca closterium]|uniref:Cell cycle checkpoint protein RAD17 n=1 Tax=Cylindrotheca closterium TaxID=2856 RepID=A0AAD2FT28_9STRA|nr:unnamed protein product [Cylindrotheca closterium]
MSSSQPQAPKRLSWPLSLDTTTSNESKPSSRKSSNTRVSFEDDSSSKDVMWVDRFTPRSSKELCVAPKKVKEIRNWIEDALKHRENKLMVLVGSPGIGKSTTVRVLANEMDLDVLSWNASYVPRSHATFQSNTVSVQQTSAIDSFRDFLQHSGTGFSSLQMSGEDHSASRRESIILLEELPNLHGLEAARRFREMMSHHMSRSQAPTVLIFSDVSEGKHRPDDLEKLIDPTVLYSSSASIRQIHPATKPQMKKVLDRICKQTKCKVSEGLLEELHFRSGGDIRYAVMNLQVHVPGSSPRSSSKTIIGNGRDVKLSTFHALGKLLYAKRKEENGKTILAFNPDNTLERSDLGIRNSLRFLEYHSVDFFTDIADLSCAFDLYSDAASLLDHPDWSRSDTSFMEPYAASVAGRTVAETNKNPAPRKFRQFSTPKIFDVLRKRRENQHLFHQLERKVAGMHLSMSNAIGQASSFNTDTLPYLRTIAPNDVNPHVDNLYSITGQPALSRDHQRNETDKILEDQTAILEMDDIVDYDTDGSGNGMKPQMDQPTSHLPPKAKVESIDYKADNCKNDPASVSPCEPEIIVIDD